MNVCASRVTEKYINLLSQWIHLDQTVNHITTQGLHSQLRIFDTRLLITQDSIDNHDSHNCQPKSEPNWLWSNGYVNPSSEPLNSE